MKITVDEILCTGHGECHTAVPDVYELDELAFNTMGTFEAPAGLGSGARAGAACCPEFAISILDDPAQADS